jgi:hypothetical protein
MRWSIDAIAAKLLTSSYVSRANAPVSDEHQPLAWPSPYGSAIAVSSASPSSTIRSVAVLVQRPQDLAEVGLGQALEVELVLGLLRLRRVRPAHRQLL